MRNFHLSITVVAAWQRLGLLSVALLLTAHLASHAQGVGIGTGASGPDASAALEIVSTTKGLLLPRVASTSDVASPAPGLLVYQTGGTAGLYYNTGSSAQPSWQQLVPASTTAYIQNQTTQQASSSFSVSGSGAVGGTLTAAQLQVSGALSAPYVTTGSATSFTLTSAHQTVRRFGNCTTITLPDASTCAGRLYTIINSNGTGTNVTLAVAAGGGIYDDAAPNGTGGTVGATITSLAANNRVTLQSSGTGWIVVGR